MKILCDSNVAPNYANALRKSDQLEFAHSCDVLSPEASDPAIIEYAETHDWVILTSDKRFLIDDEDRDSTGNRLEADCSVIFYAQDRNPTAGEVVDAPETIAENAEDYRMIETYVP